MPIVAPLEPPAFAGEVQPRAALLWYEAEGRLLGTLHPLSATRRGQAVIGAGRPFTHRDLQEWLALLAGPPDRAAVAWLPSTVLAHGADFTVWWRPARVGPMWFLLQGQRFGVRVPWPPLLFVAREQRLWCAALAEDARPEPETPLFHAPLMNVDANGQVCLGTADVPPDGTLAYRADWEAVVRATNFTHVNHRQTLQVPGARGRHRGALRVLANPARAGAFSDRRAGSAALDRATLGGGGAGMNATNPDPASFAAPLDWALFAGAETLVQPPSDASLSLGSRLRRDERK